MRRFELCQITRAIRAQSSNVQKFRFARVLCLLSLAVCVTSCGNWSDKNVHETKRRGDVILHALEQYRLRTGAFPNDLKQLVPEYVKEIPQPSVGARSWEY